MTMRMYCDRKGIALDGVKVTLQNDKVHADDCENCETTNGTIDRISVQIEVSGDMDDTTRDKVIAIAEKCPVHRTLQSEVLIESNH
jgi:putative redox protein